MSGQVSYPSRNISRLKVEDNFLDQDEFEKMRFDLFNPPTPVDWRYNSGVDYSNAEEHFMFNHIFYENNVPTSNQMGKISPILQAMVNKRGGFVHLQQIKANLYTRTPSVEVHKFHCDYDAEDSRSEMFNVSIFYINNNNGFTEFSDGTKVESVENRLVTFPGNLSHRGTTCSDEKVRCVINFRYFQEALKSTMYQQDPPFKR